MSRFTKNILVALGVLGGVWLALFALSKFIGDFPPDPDPIPVQPPTVPETSFRPHCDTDPLYGHKRYPQYDGYLVTLPFSDQRLHPDAAQAFLDMQADAREAGYRLIGRSGFRDQSQQSYLFYEIAKQRGQTPEQRALVSAPPGHSEHATGLTIDINDIEFDFAASREYQWLLQNAARYGFELSFPEDNAQGIAFEPWHWRFVGTDYAREIFCLQEAPVEDTDSVDETTGEG